MNRSPHPVATTCPKCGSGQYHKVDPDWQPAILNDRICDECATRYSPPTPLWAPWAAMALALFCLVSGGVFMFQFFTGGPNVEKLSPEYWGLLLGAGCVGVLISASMIVKQWRS